jgi:hypothetical protein
MDSADVRVRSVCCLVPLAKIPCQKLPPNLTNISMSISPRFFLLHHVFGCFLRQLTKTKNIGVVFRRKKQEHEEAGTAKQGTEQSL